MPNKMKTEDLDNAFKAAVEKINNYTVDFLQKCKPPMQGIFKVRYKGAFKYNKC